MNRSSELDTLRTVCNLFVLSCHAWAAFQYVKWTGFEWWGMTWFCASASHMIMPALFFLSGYLLMGDFSFESYKRKMKTRVKRLLVPYVCWNIFFVVFYLVAAAFVPRLATRVAAFGLDSWQGALGKILHPTIGPIDGPLWYIRSVFVYSLISPLIWFLIRSNVLMLVFAFVLLPICVFVPLSAYPVWSMVCFCLGCWFRRVAINPIGFFKGTKWLLVGLFGTVIYQVQYFGNEMPGGFVALRGEWTRLCENVGYVLGLPLFWSMVKPLDQILSGKSWFKVLTKAGFFIYASHFLFCSILLHLIAPLLSVMETGKFTFLIFIFCVPGLAFILMVWWVMRKICPRVLMFFDGTL